MPWLSRRVFADGALWAGCSGVCACVSLPPEGPELESRPTAPEVAEGGLRAFALPEAGSAASAIVDASLIEGESGPVDAPHDVDAATSRGRLPPEVIQHVVHSHFGAIRHCYEDAVRRIPGLAGNVTTKFVIGRDGAVDSSVLVWSSLPDDVAVDCVVKEFANLHFPPPSGGPVTVVYPAVFNP